MEQDNPPQALGSIRLAEVLGALSRALDLTEGQPAGHSIRCSFIGSFIGRAMGLGKEQLSDLYYTLMLKDLGCSSNAARICELYLADDRTFKHDFKRIDGSLSQALRFVLSHTGLQAGLAERFRAMINIVQNGGEISRELIETRCNRGADIARRMRFSDEVATGIQHLDEHWDGSGKPSGLAGTDIHIFARIALVAQVADVFNISSGSEAAVAEIRNRAGTWFDPKVAKTFDAIATPMFWELLAAPGLESRILELEPAQSQRVVDDGYLDDIAQAFAQVIDAKSPYTAGHSERVTLFADMIAEQLGFDDARRRWLRRAALLHDIGKLGVSNTILDKPGKLDDEEWKAMKMHAAHSQTILSGIGIFSDLAAIAAAHHERLDGKGYPLGLTAKDLKIETRILSVADVFDALTAERPYRAAMPAATALALMGEQLGTAFDRRCFNALQAALLRSQLAAA